MRYSKELKRDAYNKLQSIRDGVYYTLNEDEKLFDKFIPYSTVTSVSRSGMSRYIKIYVVDAYKEIRNITYHIAVLLGEPYDDNKGVRINGVGMDMIFHSLYRLNGAMIENNDQISTESKRELINGRGSYNYYITTNYRRI